MDGVAAGDVAFAMRGRGFHLREHVGLDGTTYLYGNRHRHTKLATLLTHLGLILFLVAAAVTSQSGTSRVSRSPRASR